eukprot:4092210-Amphidinium_carterae.1
MTKASHSSQHRPTLIMSCSNGHMLSQFKDRRPAQNLQKLSPKKETIQHFKGGNVWNFAVGFASFGMVWGLRKWGTAVSVGIGD